VRVDRGAKSACFNGAAVKQDEAASSCSSLALAPAIASLQKMRNNPAKLPTHHVRQPLARFTQAQVNSLGFD